jgi:superfamily I DNA and/or RNA helicase
MEADAETARLAERRRKSSGPEAERTGETLLDLAISDHTSGLGGRFLLTLVKRNRTLSLPWNRLRVGSPVVLAPMREDEGDLCQGVVSARSQQSIQVAVNDYPDGERFRLDLSPDEVTRQRQVVALNVVVNARGRIAALRDVLLGEREPRFAKPAPLDPGVILNSSQCDAVAWALAAEDLAIIHGPPGTGKTTTVVELIRQAVLRDQCVLALAPSNTAVDNMLARLIDRGVRAVRLGHPARVDAKLREHTLDQLVENHESMRWVRGLMLEVEQLYRKASRFTRAKPAPGQRQELRREAKKLKAEARDMERAAVKHVLDSADVICATTTFDPEPLGDRHFDLAVVDEACQCTEPGCWIPVIHADRIVLAGDHCQLPPTVLSTEATREGFGRSMLERLIDHYGGAVTRQLTMQYRMHEQIMRFSSQSFYDDTLEADVSVKSHTLADLDGIPADPLTSEPITYIDTAGAGWDEELEPDGESRRNLQEARWVLSKVAELRERGLASRDIAVIAPYAAQVRWLRENARDDALEIDTVDGFQGREKEAVLITLVRSNTTGEIGFLADTRRMNVALTRARRKLIVIGDSATLAHHPFYVALLDYFESIGAYHTVWEEM